MADQNEKRCSFCGKAKSQVDSMFSAGDSNICSECVCYCYEVLYGAGMVPQPEKKSGTDSEQAPKDLEDIRLMPPTEIKKVLEPPFAARSAASSG